MTVTTLNDALHHQRDIRSFPLPVSRVSILLTILLLILLPFLQPAFRTVRTPDLLADRGGGHGFYSPETDEANAVFAWTEPDAETTFPVLPRTPLMLTLSLRSVAIAGGPDAPIYITVNDLEVASIHPIPTTQFQTFAVPIPPLDATHVTIALHAEPFHPGAHDRRILGTMIQRIAVDQSAPWLRITRGFFLYATLPLLTLLFGLWRWQRAIAMASAASPSATYGRMLRGCCILAAVIPGLVTLLLLTTGPIDSVAYTVWIAGGLFLTGAFALLAYRLPVDSDGTESMAMTMRRSLRGRRLHSTMARARTGTLLVFPALVALHFLHSPGTGDVGDKLMWMQNLATAGLRVGTLQSASNYPPFTYVILYGVMRGAHLSHLSNATAYQLSLVAFLFLTGLVFYAWTRNAPLASALECALLLDTTALGYNDVYFLPVLILAFWALQRGKYAWFLVGITLATLIKWQALFLLPVPLLFIIQRGYTRHGSRKTIARQGVWLLLPTVGLLTLTLAIFRNECVRQFQRALGERYLSANALNANWLLTAILHHWFSAQFPVSPLSVKRYIRVDTIAFTSGSAVLFVCVLIVVLYQFRHTKQTFTATLLFTYLGYLAYFLFDTNVHENHLIPALLIGAALWWRAERFGPVFLITALMANVNLVLFYGLHGVLQAPPIIHRINSGVVIAAGNLALFTGLLVTTRIHAFPSRKTRTLSSIHL